MLIIKSLLNDVEPNKLIALPLDC